MCLGILRNHKEVRKCMHSIIILAPYHLKKSCYTYVFVLKLFCVNITVTVIALICAISNVASIMVRNWQFSGVSSNDNQKTYEIIKNYYTFQLMFLEFTIQHFLQTLSISSVLVYPTYVK
jgi:hypothetical protein